MGLEAPRQAPSLGQHARNPGAYEGRAHREARNLFPAEVIKLAPYSDGSAKPQTRATTKPIPISAGPNLFMPFISPAPAWPNRGRSECTVARAFKGESDSGYRNLAEYEQKG